MIFRPFRPLREGKARAYDVDWGSDPFPASRRFFGDPSSKICHREPAWSFEEINLGMTPQGRRLYFWGEERGVR